jgi:hypothetical protein
MPRNGAQTRRDRSRHSGGDDMAPDGEEARAQRRATSMPIVWLGLGLLVVLAFTAALGLRFGARHPAAIGASTSPSSAVAPTKLNR